jgi:hypothetical protein
MTDTKASKDMKLHVSLQDGDIVHEITVPCLQSFLKFWKESADMTSFYKFYISSGKEGTGFPESTIVASQMKTQDDVPVFEDSFLPGADPDDMGLLNRCDPHYEACIYFHDPNSCNLWENKTQKQWKHVGYKPCTEDDSDSSTNSESSESSSSSASETDDADNSDSSSQSESASESSSDEESALSESEKEEEEEADKSVHNPNPQPEMNAQSEVTSGGKRKSETLHGAAEDSEDSARPTKKRK